MSSPFDRTVVSRESYSGRRRICQDSIGHPCPIEKRPYRDEARAPSRRRRRACGSPRAPSSCTARSARPAPRSARSPSTPGVRRSTVYRHFPDEARAVRRLLGPLGRGQPAARLGALGGDRGSRTSACALALGELYAYYRRTERMIDNLLRDEPGADRRRADSARFRGYLGDAAEIADARQAACAAAPAERTRAAIGHALAFSTWQLARRATQGLDDAAGRRADVPPGRRRRLSFSAFRKGN